MKKWAKLLTVPLTLSMLVACGNEAAEDTTDETAETEETTETTEDSASAEDSAEESSDSEDSEDSDADTEATEDGEDGEGGWSGTDSESGMTPEEALEQEDLTASGEAEKGTTIEDVDMTADDWTEQAAEATDAVEGDTYVKLDRGVLTVDQIDNFLKAMPVELTYADDNNQFIYYNHMLEPEEMLGARDPIQVGNPLEEVHPEGTYQNVAWVVSQLRNKETDVVRMAVPSGDEDQFVVHDYYGIYDDDGNYMGINEIIHDIMPHVEFYLEQTGAEITYPEGYEDATSGATEDE